MIEGVTRAKGLVSLSNDLGVFGMPNLIRSVPSSAAKSFVSRRGLGKMRHLDIRDLWLQQEVAGGRVLVEKVDGEVNPADLMTKILGVDTIERRLKDMKISMVWDGSR